MMHIDFSHAQTHILYHFWMTLAVVVPFAMAWFYGIKKGFPAATWLTTLGILYGLGILGARLGAFRAEEWAALFHHGEWHSEAQKTVVGGAILVLFGFQILKKWFKLPASAADAVVFGLPIGAVLGRMGCLSAGCCYGTPTDGWWSMTFGPSSSAFLAQVSGGKIAADALTSLPLHPVQLDLLLFNVLIFAFLWFFRKKMRPGQLALAGLGLMAMGRFGSEFFRDLATNRGATGQIFLGIKTVQWVALSVAGGCLAIGFFKKKGVDTAEPRFREQSFLQLSVLIFPLSALLWVFRLRLGVLETLVFMFTFTPAIAAVLVGIWQKEKENWVRWPSVALLSGTVALQMVAQADSTVGPKPPFLVQHDSPKTWWEIGGGIAAQRYHDYDATTVGSGCDAQTTVHRDRQIFTKSTGFEGSYNYLNNDLKASVGGRVGFGQTDVLKGFPKNPGGYSLMGLFGSVDYDWIGFNGGLTVLPENARDRLGLKRGSSDIKMIGGVKVGLMHRYSFDMQFRDRQQFLFYPNPDFTIGLVNWGFNDRTGQTWMRLGVGDIANLNAGVVFGAFRFPVWQRRMSIEGGVYAYPGVSQFAFSAGVKYHLPAKSR